MPALLYNVPKKHKRNHLATIEKLLSDADRVVICSGWIKLDGVGLLKNSIAGAVARGVAVTVYSNRPRKDEKKTEVQQAAVDLLVELGVNVIATTKKFLHSKLWYFESKGKYHALIGSANMTEGGLRVNEELSAPIDGEIGDEKHSDIAEYLRHVDGLCGSRAVGPEESTAEAVTL